MVFSPMQKGHTALFGLETITQLSTFRIAGGRNKAEISSIDSIRVLECLLQTKPYYNLPADNS